VAGSQAERPSVDLVNIFRSVIPPPHVGKGYKPGNLLVPTNILRSTFLQKFSQHPSILSLMAKSEK
jgi:hypothetical protein